MELRQWIALSTLDAKKIADRKSMNRGEVWKKIVETLRQKRRDLEREEDELDAECVLLNISSFKFQAEEAIGNVLADVMGYLESSLNIESTAVREFLVEVNDKLDKKPESTDELRLVWETFDQL